MEIVPKSISGLTRGIINEMALICLRSLLLSAEFVAMENSGYERRSLEEIQEIMRRDNER